MHTGLLSSEELGNCQANWFAEPIELDNCVC